MELIWRCNNCGHIFPAGNALPETCPNCGKGKEFFEHVLED
jgi:rubrerythrin